MSDRILMCWIGAADLAASTGETKSGAGPIAQAIAWRQFSRVILLSDWAKANSQKYVAWLKARTTAKIELRLCKLSTPTDFGDIYRAVTSAIGESVNAAGNGHALTFHLSPGTPAMAAVWIIVAKTRFPADLIESSREHGVRVASVPFDISADFIPDLILRADRQLERLADAQPAEASSFGDILHRSAEMKTVIAHARRVAARSIPVLIEGESGTGKELMARAIHNAGQRANKPFIPVNCGAVPTELVESEFFGHKKGAFTGAQTDRKGHFEQADGGTLFLDEIGELPKAVQVKLLRVLQEKQVVRVGESKAIAVDVRIIAATNRSLADEVVQGRFREDLLYRLAVAVLRLPALRERGGDKSLLIERLLDHVNTEAAREQPGYQHKQLSASARNLLLNHGWPGNVRELLNTLQRAALWSDDQVIDDVAIKNSLLRLPQATNRQEAVLSQPFAEGFSLPAVLNEVGRHYIERALEEAHGNRTRAAALLGLSSYQTLNNWIQRYGVAM